MEWWNDGNYPMKCVNKKKLLILGDQDHCIGGNAFFLACEAELFGGGGFYGDIVDGDLHYSGEGIFHNGDIVLYFWSLEDDDGVDVADLPSFFPE